MNPTQKQLNDCTFIFRLPAELLHQLDAEAAELDTTRSQHARTILSTHFNQRSPALGAIFWFDSVHSRSNDPIDRSRT